MKTVLAVAILTVACFAQNRFTDGGKTFSQDGNNIIERCTAPKPPQGAALNVQTAFYQETMLCAGYVQGVADLLSDTSVCIRPEVEGKELIAAVVKYAAKHEDKLHGPASRVVASALEESYPCARTR